MRGDIDDVRSTTPCADGAHIDVVMTAKRSEFQKELKTLASDPEINELAEKARKLIERIEPQLLENI